ncbi:MAG: chitobiase/beta-hexosaminidase C-terminal domain-containing protein [Bacteroidetes bacterium]|nr:chitobiase/beta-hexosaminidase C-terminal domain-containing protein [Bacteroidota bacterium]
MFDAGGTNISSLYVNSPRVDVSVGRSPDADADIVWMSPTPGSTNNVATVYIDSLAAPILSVATGIVNDAFSLDIINPNDAGIDTKVVYTLDGSEPLFSSTEYSGTPITINANGNSCQNISCHGN